MRNQTLQKRDHGVRNHRARDPRRRVARGGLRGGQQPRAHPGVVAGRRDATSRRPGRRARSSSASRRRRAPSVPFTVVDAEPPRTFSFRWTHPAGEVAAAGNSLLVTFDLSPSGGGTLLQDDRDRLPRDGLGGRRPGGSSTASTSAAGTTSCRGSAPYVATAGVRAMSRVDGRRRPLVGDRRPDPAPDARPAAGRRRRHRDHARASSCRSPVRRWPSTSACSTGSAWSRHARGRERRYRVDEAQLARAVAQLAVGRRRPGTPGCSASSGSPRRSSAPRTRDRTTTRPRGERDGGHPAPGRRQDVDPGRRCTTALTTSTAWPAGGPSDTTGERRGRRRARVPVPAAAASTWRSLELEPAERVLWRGRRRPAGVGRHDGRLGAASQDGDYTIVLFKHEGWQEPVEFMHHCSTKWAIVPDEPEVAGRDRHGRAGAARRPDQRLALTLAATGDTGKPQRLTHGCRITDPGSSPVGRPRRRSLGYPGGASAWRALSSRGSPRMRCRRSRRRARHVGPLDFSSSRPRARPMVPGNATST